MKHFWKLMTMLLFASAIACAFTACSSDDDDPSTYKLAVELTMDDGFDAKKLSGFTVVLTNEKGKERKYGMKTPVGVLTGVPQGQYDMMVTAKIVDEEYSYVVGKTKVEIFADTKTHLTMSRVVRSPLIFKSIYTTGGQKNYMKDSYFEIVNNSDEVQYLDRLVVSSPQGNHIKPNAWQANGITDLYESGQGFVIAFPGSGTDYPLQPGESIVLANDASNHTELAGEGNHCPDLSGADWEIYISDTKKPDVDNPNVPNVDIIFQNSTSMNVFGLGFMGRAYLLARLPKDVTPQDFAKDMSNLMTTPGTSSTTQFLMIPGKYLLDAVDVWNNKKTDMYGTFLPKYEAQGVKASDTWEGKCVRRKVIRIANGRPYYQDTNNSSKDFLRNQPLTPGETPKVLD